MVRYIKKIISSIISKDFFCNGAKIINRGKGRYSKYIFGKNNRIIIGNSTLLHSSFFRIVGNNNTLFINEHCVIGPRCSFWMEGDNITIKIGKNSTFTNDVHVNAQENGMSITIGADCMLSNHIIIRTSDSHPIYDNITGKRLNPPKPIIIEDHVWIAPNSTIMKGAIIQEGCIIGSNTMVNKEITKYSLAVGMPAKVVKTDVHWTREKLF